MLTDEELKEVFYPCIEVGRNGAIHGLEKGLRAVIAEAGAQLLKEAIGICEKEAKLAWLRGGDGTGSASANHCAEEIRKLRKKVKEVK